MSSLAVTDAALTAFADEVGRDDPIAVEGGRTRWDLGGPLVGAPRLVRAPAGVVAFEPSEMTVTVRAGTALGLSDAALAPGIPSSYVILGTSF